METDKIANDLQKKIFNLGFILSHSCHKTIFRPVF